MIMLFHMDFPAGRIIMDLTSFGCAAQATTDLSFFGIIVAWVVF